MSTVIIRLDSRGEPTYLINGDEVRVYVVDERQPHDRVHELEGRVGDREIDACLAGVPFFEVVR